MQESIIILNVDHVQVNAYVSNLLGYVELRTAKIEPLRSTIEHVVPTDIQVLVFNGTEIIDRYIEALNKAKEMLFKGEPKTCMGYSFQVKGI